MILLVAFINLSLSVWSTLGRLRKISTYCGAGLLNSDGESQSAPRQSNSGVAGLARLGAERTTAPV